MVTRTWATYLTANASSEGNARIRNRIRPQEEFGYQKNPLGGEK